MAVRTKTIICPKCSRPGVYWEDQYNRNTYKQEYTLRDSKDNLPHVCDGSLSITDLEYTKELMSSMLISQTKNAVSEVTNAAKNAEYSIQASHYEFSEKLNRLGDDLSNSVHEAQLSLSNSVHEAQLSLSTLVPKLVEETVKQLVPVEHNILVKYQYGSGNSSTYTLPRQRPHKQLQECIELAQLRIPTYLVGPAGGGKTTSLRQLAECLNLEFYYDNMGPATSQWDMKGFLNAIGDYVEGVLRKPYEFGGVAFLDEIDNSNPMVLTALNALIANDYYRFPDKIVARHEDFVFFGAGNTFGRGADRQYVGRQKLDAATLDRFAYINFEYDEEAEFDWAGHAPWVKYVQSLRHCAFQHKMEVIISPRASIYGAKMLRSGININRVCETLLWAKMSESDSARLKSEVGVPNVN